MLKRRAAYIVILSLLFTGIANVEGAPFSVFGMHGLSCGKYIQDITTSPEATNVYSWWVAGFVNGNEPSKRKGYFYR